MSMFCYQCQETAKGTGCALRGVCGKTADVSNLQDLLIYTLKGISAYALKARQAGIATPVEDKFIMEGLFATITNANFDKAYFVELIHKALAIREATKDLLKEAGVAFTIQHDSALWHAEELSEIEAKAATVGILATENEDVRSLRELLTYGVKGMAAYAEHAYTLGYKEDGLFLFMQKALVATTNDSLSADELVGLIMECGKYGVDVMAL